MRSFLSQIKNETELYKYFGKYSRYLFGGYVIEFNNKLMQSDMPTGLFEKVKEEYKNILAK